MNIICWNVNGIRAVLRKNFSQWLTDSSADIVCVQETKISEPDITDQMRSMYPYTYWHCAEKKGYSGVAIFSKHEPLSVSYMGVPRFDSEGRVLCLEFKDYYLLNIYFPNGQRNDDRLQYKMDFYDAHFNHVEKLRGHKPVIVCGDYNTAHKEIDLARPRQNVNTSGFLPIERAWIDKYVDAGYIDTLRLFNSAPSIYTWWSFRSAARSRNVGWRIDYFFVSSELQDKVVDAYVLSGVLGSDHCPIGIKLK
jgi:exodeoxyribonuclease III